MPTASQNYIALVGAHIIKNSHVVGDKFHLGQNLISLASSGKYVYFLYLIAPVLLALFQRNKDYV